MKFSEVRLDHQSLGDHKRNLVVYEEDQQWCDVSAPCQSATMIIHHTERKTSFFDSNFGNETNTQLIFLYVLMSEINWADWQAWVRCCTVTCKTASTLVNNNYFVLHSDFKRPDQSMHTILILPAQPKARWYLEVGLNLTQQTLALASMLATELSRLVDHNFTETQKQTHQHFSAGKCKISCYRGEKMM